MVLSDNNKDLLLFYGVYDTKQLLTDNKELIPCIFENKYPWKHEFQIYKAIYNLVSSSEENKENIIGLLSSSFMERTGLNYDAVNKLIEENKADIYIFSPYQYNSLIFYNYWDQAEICHEGIKKEVKQIFSLSDSLPKIDFKSRTPKIHFSYCNFWAAKRDYFLKIVKDMILLDELMAKNKLGLKETHHRSQFVYRFNENFKKKYKLFPFIIERYLSATLMNKNNNFNPKVFYWNDNRKIIDQVEKIENLLDIIKGPISRGLKYKSIKKSFKNKKDFYKKIWLDTDIERLSKISVKVGEGLLKLKS